MLRFFFVGQLGLVACVLALVGERGRELFLRAPTSPEAVAWIKRRLQAGDLPGALAWARRRSETYVAQVLLLEAGERSEAVDRADFLRIELPYAATKRLGVLRVAATLASILGLLGGILAIGHGFQDDSLLALQAGNAQRVAFAHALEAMALGVGTSGFCFYALGLFRRATRDVLAQATHITHILAQQDVGLRTRAKGTTQ